MRRSKLFHIPNGLREVSAGAYQIQATGDVGIGNHSWAEAGRAYSASREVLLLTSQQVRFTWSGAPYMARRSFLFRRGLPLCRCYKLEGRISVDC